MPARAIIEPYKFNIPLMLSAVEISLDEVAQEAVKNFELSYATWQTHKPKIEVMRSKAKRAIIVTDSVYGFINFGTDVRHALMSNPFYPKTSPGVLSAGSGVGGMVRFGRNINRPGIKPRRFDMIIAEIAQGELVANMSKTMASVLSKRI